MLPKPRWPYAVAALLLVGVAYLALRDPSTGEGPTPLTCADWTALDTADQRDRAGAMLLTALREKDGRGAPTTAQAAAFADGISNVCAADRSQKVAEVAAGVYLTERGRFG